MVKELILNTITFMVMVFIFIVGVFFLCLSLTYISSPNSITINDKYWLNTEVVENHKILIITEKRGSDFTALDLGEVKIENQL